MTHVLNAIDLITQNQLKAICAQIMKNIIGNFPNQNRFIIRYKITHGVPNYAIGSMIKGAYRADYFDSKNNTSINDGIKTLIGSNYLLLDSLYQKIHNDLEFAQNKKFGFIIRYTKNKTSDKVMICKNKIGSIGFDKCQIYQSF